MIEALGCLVRERRDYVVPALNEHPAWLRTIARLVRDAAAVGTAPEPAGG